MISDILKWLFSGIVTIKWFWKVLSFLYYLNTFYPKKGGWVLKFSEFFHKFIIKVKEVQSLLSGIMRREYQ